MSQIDYTEHIARISMGKDSLKMLHVIITRGLPLDGVTTTDVWATDTIRAELPDVLIAKERIEEKLWQMYRIEVDHLCARNKDGSKRTYEQMFYHIPNRRSQDIQVERERRLQPGSIRGFPDLWNKWCQSDLKRNAWIPSAGINYRIPANTRYNWCQKLKIVPDSNQGMADNKWVMPLVSKTQSSSKAPLFSMPCHEGQEKKDRGIHRHCS